MHTLDRGPAGTAGGAGYCVDFTPGLLDPTRTTPALVTGPNGKAADKRFNVYRNNVTVSLINALAAVYPAVMRITGEPFFRAMARFHVREMPPTSPLLLEYGRDFPDFIDRYQYAQSMPWLADVARIERAWLDAYHAADAAALSPTELVAVPPDRLGELVFEAHPATRILHSDYPAVTVFSVNRASEPVGPIETTLAESALVTRPMLDVEVRRLAPGVGLFLGGLMAGETMASAAAAAGEANADFDLAAAIRVMLEAGAFAAIRRGG